MIKLARYRLTALAVLLLVAACFPLATLAQGEDTTVVLTGAELARVVPSGFYFEGQSAPTQLRNSAAARFSNKRHIVAGLVDTSGYSADIRAKYEGFLITDSPISIGGSELGIGAYGFGFTEDGKFNIFDISGKQVLSTSTTKDQAMRRPRPLMMKKAADGLRLYSGLNYVVIALK